MLIAILYLLGVSAGGILIVLLGLMVLNRIKTIRNPAVFKARVRYHGRAGPRPQGLRGRSAMGNG